MEKAPAVSDLERRKQIRVRLREDVSITQQKYEGRTYYVVKDPVSLRYYRFKEQERFLLDLMDGKHTLDEAQKLFEQRFRPERLTLEDLEGFTSQLLQAGLAQNEAPNAGKQLFDRFKKRKRSQFAQKWLNILYIKIPVYDPDKLLRVMLPPLRFIFTLWFLFLSVAFIMSAVFLVGTHWNTFYSKLPTAQEFFVVGTLVYLWVALGIVKIIHEFGHGLSCKAFGGEVHEMGFLFLVFSPCLYCNVSDAWTLPSKWKRIIISAAGIYVELIIASIATYIWWGTDNGTFLNSMCLSMVVVCSFSTIVFNANPLMRFDGYYMLADWLEIPNLRDRSNKYIQHLAMEHLLGMEVPPEQYMTTSRKVLFITYAVTSYIYRWVVTFSILFFMYTFLKPYKLSALSFLLGTGAVGTMFGWPLYRLGKYLHRRGRIPDMKSGRVWAGVAVIVVFLIGFATIPFPVKVRSLALIQMDPAKVGKVVIPETGGFLQRLDVVDGQRVQKGDVLAVLNNPELEVRLKTILTEQALRRQQLVQIKADAGGSSVVQNRLAEDFITASLQIEALHTQEKDYREQIQRLILRAPRDGVVKKLVDEKDVGKVQERGAILCEVGDDQTLQAVMMVSTAERNLVKRGDGAWIRVHGLGYNYFPGTVVDISAKEAREVPKQLMKNYGGEVVVRPDMEAKMEVPELQHYVITVRFDEKSGGVQPGVLCRVKVVAESQTLWWRFQRYLADTFNWGL